MFERFSKEARAAVVEAQTVARAAGSRSIDGRHVLVALAEGEGPAPDALRDVGVDPVALARRVRDDVTAGGLDGAALASLGVDLDAVRRQADAAFGEGALDRASRRAVKGHIPFTPDAKKILELSLREALRLGSSGIDGGHVLLGMLRAKGAPAELALRAALADAGTDPTALQVAAQRRADRAS